MKKRIERVLLINPFCIEDVYDPEVIRAGGQFAEDPIGLRYLASYIRREFPDVCVEIYDANLKAIEIVKRQNACDMDTLWDTLRKEIADFKPDIAGVSCLFHSSAFIAHRTCSQIKAVFPESVTIMGGAYPTISYKEALADEHIDYVVLSEGEKALAALIRSLRETGGSLENIDGIAFRDPAKNVVKYEKKEYADLDSLPWPDRADTASYTLRPRHYIMRVLDPERTRVATVVGSRGCPFHCSFCSTTILWGNRARHRNVADILDEMKYLIDTFGVNAFVFNDDNISVNKAFILSLCSAIIKAKLAIHWVSGGIQVSTLTDEVIQAMYESGFVVFNLGIETGSQDTLKRIKKPLRLDAVAPVIKAIRKYEDAYILGMFIVGFPFETKKEIQDTLHFASALDLDWRGFFCFKPFPGTADYDYCVSKGYIDTRAIKFTDYSKASEFSTEHFAPKYVERQSYLANLKSNFIDNRALRNGNLHRAIKDFKYVLNIQPEHAIAHYALSCAYGLAHEKTLAADALKRAQHILTCHKMWKGYFDELGIAL